ncbi:MAG: hypothetical protein ACD_70C00184G0002 [uncultured bacterium]|nr:MAG: hypothetical protein ACD_70C00184G0002 [uncultured bacterium]OGT26096.1 MAG: putative addiction module antidote protein [Gammaproteobacteria bacterium RIFCSPHIGHO2_02_FULL_42_43]OGT28477.1 MAG: putative addiction module antidote protein [Gammaproteobacteria bacterium RIFCSPHIGHO2_01_FULL_42_8]OGT50881.1 MAG: putative addiction module antidote protein [Gammaproteobacteria bacterium RIFCSPHIGHO2_12_FULL_41_25]OGT62838.1 MAG: putative addiction module antidote protein [Gammaproteobacteria 
MNKKIHIKKSYRNLSKYEDYLIKKLKNKRYAAMYLQEALEDYQESGDTAVLLIAFRYVAKAQGGIAGLAKKTHLHEKTLYRTLSKNGNPRLDTLWRLFSALGFQLRVATA